MQPRMASPAISVPAVHDGVFEEAAKHFDEKALNSLLVQITVINAWNRLNVSTRQVPGSW